MHVCPRCRRANPDEAVFCHFDGAELRPAHGGVDRQAYLRLPHDFYFPGGRCCHTYDELIEGCQEEWALACNLLDRGVFERFLTGIGRLDLADMAARARTGADPDVALESFLAGLPTSLPRKPALEVEPAQVELGTLGPAQTRQVELRVRNRGQGLLHGVLTVGEGAEWLKVTTPDLDQELSGLGLELVDAVREVPIKAPREQPVTLQADARGLAAPRGYAGRVTLITNGGTLEVPVRMEVDVHPFPWGPFQGARTAHELAQRMAGRPKEAVPYFETNEVARWFATNGWHYPVKGATAPGMGAVQQFFEELGLSRPPAVWLSEADLVVACVYPQVTPGRLKVQTSEKKWVYARGESDAVWLRVTTPSVCGPRKAVLGFEVDAGLLEPGQVYQGTLHVVANAGQRLAARVLADVQWPREPLAGRLFGPYSAG